ncbi:MAG: hypothetical protein ACOYB5_03180 [Patescibacteria group bacterium]|jgi:hypothetical protein
MNFKTNISSKSFKLETRHVLNLAARAWSKIHMTLFFTLLFCSIGFGGYIWRNSVSGANWTDQEKQEYLNMQNTKTVFRENDFRKVLEDVQRRKAADPISYQPINDIFEPYQ